MDFYTSELYLNTLKSCAFSADKALSFLEDSNMTSLEKQDRAEGWYYPLKTLAFELNSFHDAKIAIPEVKAFQKYDFVELCNGLSEEIVGFMGEDELFVDMPVIAQSRDENLWRELYSIDEELSQENSSAELDMMEYWYKSFLVTERFNLSEQKDKFSAEEFVELDFYFATAENNLREVFSDEEALRTLYSRRKEEGLPATNVAFDNLALIRLKKESVEDFVTLSPAAQEDQWDQYEFNQDIKENPRVMALFKQYLIDWAKYIEKGLPLYLEDVIALRQNLQTSDKNSIRDYDEGDDDDDDIDNEFQNQDEAYEFDDNVYYELVIYVEEIYALQCYSRDLLGVCLGKMNLSPSEIEVLHDRDYSFGYEELHIIKAVIEDFKEEYELNKTYLNSMSEDKDYEAINEFLRYPVSLEKHKMINALMAATDGAYKHLYDIREHSVTGVANQIKKDYNEQYENLSLDIECLMKGQSVVKNIPAQKVVKEVHRAVVKTHLLPNDFTDRERKEALIYELDDKIGLRSMDADFKNLLYSNIDMYLKGISTIYKKDKKNENLSQGLNLAIKRHHYWNSEFAKSNDLQDKLDFCSKADIYKYEDFQAYEGNKSLYEAGVGKDILLPGSYIAKELVNAKCSRN